MSRATRYALLSGGVAGVLLIAVQPALAQAGRAPVRDGNRLYEEGRFEEAHQRYLEALAEAPGSGVIEFNDGNALYRSQEYQRAMEAYQRAIETDDPALASSAWYNLGNALYRQQQLESSLEAYKQALRLAPDDVDAKHNLERVLEQMQEQEQDNQQQDQQEQEEPSQDDQDQQQEDQQEQDQQNDQQQEQEESDDQQDQQDEQPEGEQPGEQPPGQMTPEEAERLLDAIEEDPDDVDRRPAAATGRRPRRPW